MSYEGQIWVISRTGLPVDIYLHTVRLAIVQKLTI